MNHLSMNFASAAAQGNTYTLTCTNKSSASWIFYVYQTMPSQPSQVFSLAWFASPYKIAPGASITFQWSINYSFVWGNSGIVTPGVTFTAGQSVPCSITGANKSTFSMENNTPNLSAPVTGGQVGSLTVLEDSSVPNNTFATGIGMSGVGTFVQQALANTTQVYTPTPLYWIAAATQMQMGVVLAQTISQTAQVSFPTNVYNMNAVLGSNNVWTVS